MGSGISRLSSILGPHRGKFIGFILGLFLRIGPLGVILGTVVGGLWDELTREKRYDLWARQLLEKPSLDKLEKLPKKERDSFLLAALGETYLRLLQENPSLLGSIEENFDGALLRWLGPDEGARRGIERHRRTTAGLSGDWDVLCELSAAILPASRGEGFLDLLRSFAPSGDSPPQNAAFTRRLCGVWNLPLPEAEDRTEDYRLLGLSPEVSLETLRQTFRALASQFHPDTGAALSKRQQAEAEEAFMRIRRAYERILNERSGEF